MSCDKNHPRLPEYVLKTLPADESAEVARHLDSGCPRCAAELADLQSMLGELALEIEPVAPPDSVLTGLKQRVRESQAAETVSFAGRSVERVRSSRPRATAWPYYVAASIAAVAGGLTARWSQTPAVSSPTPSAEAFAEKLDGAQKAFAAPSARLAQFGDPQAPGETQGYVVADGVAEQVQLVVRGGVPPQPGVHRHAWLLDSRREVLADAPLEVDPTGAGSVIIPCPKGIARVASVIVTDESDPPGPAPGGNVLLETSLQEQAD